MPFQVPGSPLKHVLKCRSPSTSFALGGEAHRLLLTKTAADPMVQLYDLATGEHVRDIETSVGDMHVTPSGTRLIVIDRISEKSIKVSGGTQERGFGNTYVSLSTIFLPTKSKYLNSPYYIGTQIWNTLTEDVQRMENKLRFEKCIEPVYRVYRAPVV